jgi:hypothetical protein
VVSFNKVRIGKTKRVSASMYNSEIIFSNEASERYGRLVFAQRSVALSMMLWCGHVSPIVDEGRAVHLVSRCLGIFVCGERKE